MPLCTKCSELDIHFVRLNNRIILCSVLPNATTQHIHTHTARPEWLMKQTELTFVCGRKKSWNGINNIPNSLLRNDFDLEKSWKWMDEWNRVACSQRVRTEERKCFIPSQNQFEMDEMMKWGEVIRGCHSSYIKAANLSKCVLLSVSMLICG